MRLPCKQDILWVRLPSQASTMSQATSPLDEPVAIESGQVYTDARTGDQFELIYHDSNVYIVQERSGSHRFGRVSDFEKNVRADRYSLDTEASSFAETAVEYDDREEIAFEEFDGIGQTGADNLREAGIVTEQDVHRASDEEILSVSWVGEKGLDSIRDAV